MGREFDGCRWVLGRISLTPPGAPTQARTHRQTMRKMWPLDPRQCLLQPYQEMWADNLGEYGTPERGTPDLMYLAAASSHWQRDGYGDTGCRLHSCFQCAAYASVLTRQGCPRTTPRDLPSPL